VTDVVWDTGSRRLRVIIPVRSQETTATYEVPFGFIDRNFEQEKLNYSQWKAHSMEWPTLHWVRKRISESTGVAVLNKGLPCNRWIPGRFDLSLLRSPEWQFCAVEPGNYEFWDIDGQRDAGKHRFEYSIWPYTDGLSDGDLTRAGYAYNLPRPIDPPFDITGDVVVTAWKPAENGAGWILRLQNASDAETTVKMVLGRPTRITPTNLIETPQQGSGTSETYQASLHKRRIMTLLLEDAPT
jgi:alpha-mannosidase